MTISNNTLIIIRMSRSVKINLIKIQITNDIIKTPKILVSLEFGDDKVSLPHPRFAHKNKVQFTGQSLTAITNKQGCGISLRIFGVTGSHNKEVGVVKVNYDELVENDGEVELIRRGNDDFILEFQVLYNSISNGRILTEESDAPSQDSFFEVEIDQESLGRDSVSISEGKGRRSKEGTPERSRASFEKADRKPYNPNPPPSKNVIDNSLNLFDRRKLTQRLSINSNKDLPGETQKPQRLSENMEHRQSPKPVYTNEKTIRTIKQKQSRILKATYENQHDESHKQPHPHHHHHNPEFRSIDYLHFIIVSVIFWYIGKFMKQL